MWIKQAFRDYYKPKLKRTLKRDPSQEEMDQRFEEIYSQVNCILLAGVLEGVAIYFYEIAKISKKCGANVPFLRPKNISSDRASSVDALIHATIQMEKIKNKKYDYIIELMCTNPLKNVNDIDNIIQKIKKSKSDSVIAVHRIFDHHPSRHLPLLGSEHRKYFLLLC